MLETTGKENAMGENFDEIMGIIKRDGGGLIIKDTFDEIIYCEYYADLYFDGISLVAKNADDMVTYLAHRWDKRVNDVCDLLGFDLKGNEIRNWSNMLDREEGNRLKVNRWLNGWYDLPNYIAEGNWHVLTDDEVRECIRNQSVTVV